MFVTALAYLAFFSIALPGSMFGVTWPSMSLAFGQPLSAAGLAPPIGVTAGLISATLAPRLVGRFGVGRLVAAGGFLSAIALVGSATSARWWQFLVSVAVAELAAGAIDTSLNVYAAHAFGPRQISWLHASYGVGAVMSPLIATATLAIGASWRWAYASVAALLLIVATVLAATSRRWVRVGVGAASEPSGGDRRRARLWRGPMVTGLVAVAVQGGLEATVSLWGFTFMTHHLAIPAPTAGLIASGYWGALMIARIGFGGLAERIGAWPVLRIATGLLVAAAVLVNLPLAWCGVGAVILFGVACAPVYPLLVLTTPERTSPGGTDQVIGFQSAASSVGSATLPGLVGLAMARNAGWFAPGTALLCAITIGFLLILARGDR